MRYVLWTSVVPEPSVIGSLAQNPLSGALDRSQISMLLLESCLAALVLGSLSDILELSPLHLQPLLSIIRKNV